MHKLDLRTGTWFWRFQRDGRRHFGGGYRTADQAKDAEHTYLDKLIKGENFPEAIGKDITFNEAVEWWLTEYASTKKTGYIDQGRLKLAVQFFDNSRLVDISAEKIEAFLDALPRLRNKATPRLKGVSMMTRNHYRTLLSALFNRLKKRKKYLGDNPCQSVDIIKVPKARIRFLYPAEEAALTPVAMQDSVIWPYYFMGLHTGLRISEMRMMRVTDVDFVMHQIFIPNSKNSKSRYLPMSPKVVNFLQKMVVGKRLEDRALPSWSYAYLRSRFAGMCAVAGVKNMKIHDMRHTFCQRLLGLGESIYKVSLLMGHSSVSVTQNSYGHLSGRDLARTVDKIDASFGNVEVAAEWQQGGSEVAAEKRELKKVC